MAHAMMTRRTWMRLSALAAASSALASCTGAAPPAAPDATIAPAAEGTAAPVPPAATGAGPVVTIFVGMGTGVAPEQQKVQNALAAEWNAADRGSTIEHLYTPWDESRTKWAAMMAAGTPPALNMPSGVEQVGRFSDTNLDIGPYLERDQVDLSDFGDLIPEVGKYGGVTYGIVMGVYPSVMFYNEDLFDQAELDYPTTTWGEAGWDHDAMLEMARKLSRDSAGLTAGEEGFDPANQEQWGYWDDLSPNGLALAWGAPNLGWSDDFRTMYFNQEAWVGRVQWGSDAIWEWFVTPSSQQSAAASPSFSTGKFGMEQTHSWALGEMEELPFLWNVAAIPAGPTGIVAAQCDVDAFLISKNFSDVDAAWEVAKWMMEPEQMLRLVMTWGALPPRFSLQEAYIEAMASKYPNLNMQVFFDSLNYIDVPNHETYIPRYGEVWDAWYAAQDRIRTGEEKNAQIVLDDLQATVQGYVDEFWSK